MTWDDIRLKLFQAVKSPDADHSYNDGGLAQADALTRLFEGLGLPVARMTLREDAVVFFWGENSNRMLTITDRGWGLSDAPNGWGGVVKTTLWEIGAPTPPDDVVRKHADMVCDAFDHDPETPINEQGNFGSDDLSRNIAAYYLREFFKEAVR